MMIKCKDASYVSSAFVAKLRPRDGKTDLIGADGKVIGTVSESTRSLAAKIDERGQAQPANPLLTP